MALLSLKSALELERLVSKLQLSCVGFLMTKRNLTEHLSLDFFDSRPSDHYFRSVCLFVCAEFFSAVFGPISIKLGHMLYVWI